MVPARPAQLEEPGPRGRGPLRARRRWIEVWDEETGEGFDFGRIKAWEPGKRLLLDYLIHDGGHVTEVEVRFEPTEGGTRVVLEHRGWDVSEIDRNYGEQAGIKDITLHVKGAYAFGYLKVEAGAHRLVRFVASGLILPPYIGLVGKILLHGSSDEQD